MRKAGRKGNGGREIERRGGGERKEKSASDLAQIHLPSITLVLMVHHTQRIHHINFT